MKLHLLLTLSTAEILVVVCYILLKVANKRKKNYEMLDKRLPNEVHYFAYEPYYFIVSG